jgi:ABC-type phosphate transport system substrate-binding protein
MWRLLEWTVLAFLAQVLSAFAEEMAGNAFTDPTLIWRQVPPDWETQTVRAQPGASEADLSVTLDQQLYPMLLPLIQQYAAEHRVKVAVSNGTCGISAGLLSRKAVDVGGFCCPPGLTDRLPGLRFHTLAVAAIALLVHPDNPLNEVTFREAQQIFRGEISDWSTLRADRNKGVPYPIHTIGHLHCKLRPGHWRLLLDNDDLFSPHLLEVGTIQDVIGSVAADPLAIGYETLWMMQRHEGLRRVKALSLGGVRPDDRVALASGRYPLYRVYNVTTWEGAAAKSLAQGLVRYLEGKIDHLDRRFAMVPASHLRRHGWQFQKDELAGEPD